MVILKCGIRPNLKLKQIYNIILYYTSGDENHQCGASLHESQDTFESTKVSAVPLWEGSGPQLTSLADSIGTSQSTKVTAWRHKLSPQIRAWLHR